MKRLLAAVLLAASVPAPALITATEAFSLDTLGLADLRAPAVSAPVPVSSGVVFEARPVKRFTIEIALACDAGRFQLASWCPTPGSGVAGGLERVIFVKVGDEVEIRLVNSYHVPDSSAGIGDHTFQFTSAEPIESCSQAACRAFGVHAFVPLGAETTVRFTADRAGRFKYYDGRWLNGYGVLNVFP